MLPRVRETPLHLLGRGGRPLGRVIDKHPDRPLLPIQHLQDILDRRVAFPPRYGDAAAATVVGEVHAGDLGVMVANERDRVAVSS